MKAIDEELFDIKHRKQKINSKVKGNRAELVVSKLLSDWLGTEVVRVPQSGGLHWQHSARVCGDVIVTDPKVDFPFSVEVKSYKNLGLPRNDRLLRKNSIIFTFFEQCKRDAVAAKKVPFLIVRENQMSKDQYIIFLDFTIDQLMKLENYITTKYYTYNVSGLSGYNSVEFFKKVSFKTLKWIYGIN
jgi:Holliday junction resolvase